MGMQCNYVESHYERFDGQRLIFPNVRVCFECNEFPILYRSYRDAYNFRAFDGFVLFCECKRGRTSVSGRTRMEAVRRWNELQEELQICYGVEEEHVP